MVWLGFGFILFALFTGVPAMLQGDISGGLAGTIGPILALVAGAGITSNIRGKRGSILFGLGILTAASYWMWATKWRAELASLEIPGLAIATGGFLLGLAYGAWGFEER